MSGQTNDLFGSIAKYCNERTQEFELIPADRKLILTSIAEYLTEKFQNNSPASLIAICTHNSRRSQFAQIWLAVAADYYDLPSVKLYSGGTETTAFNHRAVSTLRKIGFSVNTQYAGHENPNYLLEWKDDMNPFQMFSKVFSSPENPSSDFAAIMVCSSADEACPFVPGAEKRISLPFEDPKRFDDSPREEEAYLESCQEICREMLYALSLIK